MEIDRTPEDLSPEEKEELKKYKKDGCPGLAGINATSVAQWFDLYISGKSYTDISVSMKAKRAMIIYIAEKGRWCEKRIRKYQEISDGLLEKIKNTVLESADSLTTMIAGFNKYYTNKLTKFISTNDDSIIEGLDVKLLAQYGKSLESLDKLLATARRVGQVPPENTMGEIGKSEVNININAPNHVVEELNTIDISKAKDSGEVLKALLDIRKKNKK
jgi:hypothetical protein